MTDVLRGLVGLVVLIAIALALSQNRRAIQPRMVLAALATQVAIGALVLFVPWGRAALAAAATGVNHVLDYGSKGMEFLFGGLVTPKMFELFGDTASCSPFACSRPSSTCLRSSRCCITSASCAGSLWGSGFSCRSSWV